MSSVIEALATKKKAQAPEQVTVLPVVSKEHEGACGEGCGCGEGESEGGCCGG